MKKEFIKGLWKEHPVFRQLLGMCPTLAVTTSAINGLSMGLAVIFVLFFSSLVVALIKKLIPHQVRIAVYTVIIATFVTIVDLFFKAQFPEISRALGPYIPLIIVNCIILGRCEAFASKHSVSSSLFDALGMGLGFTWGVFLLGSIRELFGAGTILGFRLFPLSYNPLIVMILPAGAFLVLGFLVATMNKLEQK
ncbi:MAG: electron transport complex subunit E [Candidatus Omnitrophica bacterium]|nr:electron transport complex subunit E [Candidatus Omnitrophota bacterium]